MIAYRELILGHEAAEYIKKCLAGGTTLARLLLQVCNLDAGRITTFLPADVNVKDANQFTTGGKLPVKMRIKQQGSRPRMELIPNTDSNLARMIQAFLSSGKGRLCIFGDNLVRASDPCFASLEGHIVVFNDEVYHLLFGKDAKISKIRNTIDDVSYIVTLIGAMTSVPKENGTSLETRNEITSDELKALAERVENIIVSAYDSESYLIWHKTAATSKIKRKDI